MKNQYQFKRKITPLCRSGMNIYGLFITSFIGIILGKSFKKQLVPFYLKDPGYFKNAKRMTAYPTNYLGYLKPRGFKILVVLIVSLINLNNNARAQADEPTDLIYTAFVEEKMGLWARAIIILEKEYDQSGSTDILYELTLARYGYIGYNLGIDNEEPAKEHISLAEEQIDKLTGSDTYESSAYALQAAFYAYRISMAPWRAVFWGRRSMNLIDKAIETYPENSA